MSDEIITHFDLDEAGLATLGACMENYGVGSPDAEWPNNIISRRAVVYQNGVIARRGSSVGHRVSSEELALCRRLAEEAEDLMADVEVGMGSESSSQFHGFYIAANMDESVSRQIDEQLIRSKFGGTIFPPAAITVEPLKASGKWWTEVEFDASGSDAGYFRPWHGMIEWFAARSEFVDTSFVRIGDSDAQAALLRQGDSLPEGTEAAGSVLPRLALGLTHSGSLVGLFGYTVQT